MNAPSREDQIDKVGNRLKDYAFPGFDLAAVTTKLVPDSRFELQLGRNCATNTAPLSVRPIFEGQPEEYFHKMGFIKPKGRTG